MATTPVFTRPRFVLTAVIAIAAATGIWTIPHGDGQAVAAPPAEAGDKLFRPSDKQWKALAVEPVRVKVFDTQVTTEGKIVIDENRATRIYAPFSGRVTRLLVSSGDRVVRGQQLFVVEAADSIDAQKDFVSILGDINKAKAQVELTTMVEQRLAAAGIAVDASTLRDPFDAAIDPILADATLTRPDVPPAAGGGRHGRPSEHLGHLLAEMQVLARQFPGASW